MSDPYLDFLATKAPRERHVGIEPEAMPDCLLPHAAYSADKLLRFGSGGLFLDTGLTKTRIQHEWSRQAAGAVNGVGVLYTPLGVARQIEREGLANGYNCRIVQDQSQVREGLNICNYERMHLLDPAAFGSVSLDESDILANFTGKTARALIDGYQHHRFKLSASATPAPNEHMEFGMHAEFCGVMRAMEMLSMFFKNDTKEASQKWRIKRHGIDAFWDWMASWCVMAEFPSDLGFDDTGFILPPLNVHSEVTEAMPSGDLDDLFGGGSISATDIHKVKRQTSEARAKIAVDYAMAMPNEPCVLWVDTDYEADAVMRAFGDAPRTAEIRGSHSIEKKERALDGFLDGSILRLVTKASIVGRGLAWHHCNRTACVGRSFSYKAWYQLIRRFYRFGQKRPVDCLVVAAEGEEHIGRIITRKSNDHAETKKAMRRAMLRARGVEASRMVAYNPQHTMRIPSWIKSAA